MAFPRPWTNGYARDARGRAVALRSQRLGALPILDVFLGRMGLAARLGEGDCQGRATKFQIGSVNTPSNCARV